MKRKRLLLSVVVGLTALIVKADSQNYNGIFATYNGSETCYKLEEVPTVTYTEDNGVKVAQLKLKGQTEPVVSVSLKDGATLQITYGTYVPTAINEVTSNVCVTEKEGKKYISGGHLIIISKDGKQYNSNGTMNK